jgi:hypothetical protein
MTKITTAFRFAALIFFQHKGTKIQRNILRFPGGISYIFSTRRRRGAEMATAFRFAALIFFSTQRHKDTKKYITLSRGRLLHFFNAETQRRRDGYCFSLCSSHIFFNTKAQRYKEIYYAFQGASLTFFQRGDAEAQRWLLLFALQLYILEA